MAARKNLLLMAVLLLSTVAVHSVAAAAAAGGGEVRGEDYADPVAAGGYALCRPGCPDAFWNCNDWCAKNGYKNGGVCVPPLRQQCCCFSGSA